MTRIEVSLTHVLFFKPLVIYRLGGEGGGGCRGIIGGGISQGSVRREDYGKLTVNKNQGGITRILQSLGGGGGMRHTQRRIHSFVTSDNSHHFGQPMKCYTIPRDQLLLPLKEPPARNERAKQPW